MYKSASTFLQRLPQTRFWRDYVQLYQPKEIYTDDVIVQALAQTIASSASRIGIDSLNDYELAGLFVLVGHRGLLEDKDMTRVVVSDIDRRLLNEGEAITLSLNERQLLWPQLKEAASRWRSGRSLQTPPIFAGKSHE